MKLAKILKQLMKENGNTAASLSRATGVAKSSLGNWLAGTEPRNLTQLKKVADFYSITVDELCFGLKEKKITPDYNEWIRLEDFEVILRRKKRAN